VPLPSASPARLTAHVQDRSDGGPELGAVLVAGECEVCDRIQDGAAEEHVDAAAVVAVLCGVSAAVVER
jgi:hypothetical protein